MMRFLVLAALAVDRHFLASMPRQGNTPKPVREPEPPVIEEPQPEEERVYPPFPLRVEFSRKDPYGRKQRRKAARRRASKATQRSAGKNDRYVRMRDRLRTAGDGRPAQRLDRTHAYDDDFDLLA